MRVIMPIFIAAGVLFAAGCASYRVVKPDGTEMHIQSFLRQAKIKTAQLDQDTRMEGYSGETDTQALAGSVTALSNLMQSYAQQRIALGLINQPTIPPVTITPTLPAPPTPPPTPEPSGEKVLTLPEGDWTVSYTVSGLKKDPGNTANGECEHFFGDIRGDGFTRILLANMCGNRGLRVIWDDGSGDFHDAPDAPDGTMTVRVVYINGALTIAFGPTLVVTTKQLRGTPKTFTVGGGQERGRDFGGTWGNLETSW